MSDYISYRELYFRLFGAVATAAEYIEEGKTILAYQCLVDAQLEAEAACLELDILPEQ